MTADHKKRRRALLAVIASRKLDGLLVTQPANWFYLTGFTGESGALIVAKHGTTLVTDGRFTVQAAQETRGIKIEVQQGSLFTAAGAFLKRSRLSRIGYDSNQLTLQQLKTLRKALGREWRGAEAVGMVERLRMRKDAQELAV